MNELRKSTYAMMILLVAVLRAWAFAVHGAGLATTFIVAEIILGVWLIAAGMLLGRRPTT